MRSRARGPRTADRRPTTTSQTSAIVRSSPVSSTGAGTGRVYGLSARAPMLASSRLAASTEAQPALSARTARSADRASAPPARGSEAPWSHDTRPLVTCLCRLRAESVTTAASVADGAHVGDEYDERERCERSHRLSLQVPLEHAVGVEPLESEQARRRGERDRGRDAVRVEPRRDTSRACGRLDARRRQQADQLAATDNDAGLPRLGFDPLDQDMRHRRVQIDQVRRDLDFAVGQPQAQSLDAGKAAPGLADRDGDLHGNVEGRLQLDVEGDKRPPRPDEHSTGGAVEPGRTEGRSELAGLDPALELGRAAAPVVGRPDAACERPVEEHGEPQLLPNAPADISCERLGMHEVVAPQRHHGHHVRSTDARVDTDVSTKIDEAARRGNARDEPVLERPLASDERVDGAVVTRVDVGVEEPRAARCEGRPERRDNRGVAPFRDVRDGLEQSHVPTLEGVREPTAPAYYDRRAPEYDDWYLGLGLFAGRDRPGFDDELRLLVDILAGLEPAHTLDVACGTGFLTRHLRGQITGLDASPRMLAIASQRVPAGAFVRGDALALPFPDNSFDRVLSGHFYGHLDEMQRPRFLAEARRVARELVIVDASLAQSDVEETWAERLLHDGSRWEVLKRYFEPAALLDELGGGEILHAGHWVVVVRSPR